MTYKSLLKNTSDAFPGADWLKKSPFLLENRQIYDAWRKEKLSHYPIGIGDILIKIDALDRITLEEKAAILRCCNKYNMALYQVRDSQCSPEALKIFAGQFGLSGLDQHYCNDNNGITALQVSDTHNKGGFIPYSDKAINWHCDGYYNAPDQQIYSVLLHCESPAAEGGENWVMDHEIAYIRLRDENPAFIQALMHPHAMTIPAHIKDGKLLRAEQTGPVFSILDGGEKLHMRFSQRKRNIVWRDDSITHQAVAFLNHILEENTEDKMHIKLRKGQGILCNNILHNRSAFKNTEAETRLIYRGRFFESIQ